MAPKAISGKGFTGSDVLSLEHWKTLEVTSSSDGPRRLQERWSGGIIGFLVCRLANDNKSIENTTFHLGGTLFEEAKLKADCSKFWTTGSPSPSRAWTPPFLRFQMVVLLQNW